MSIADDKAECIDRWKNDNACLLDGKPAKVIGWKLDWPLVAHLDSPLAVLYSWATVNRIMAEDRRFKSNRFFIVP